MFLTDSHGINVPASNQGGFCSNYSTTSRLQVLVSGTSSHVLPDSSQVALPTDHPPLSVARYPPHPKAQVLQIPQ